MKTLLGLLALAALVAGQDVKKETDKDEPKLRPLKPGEVRILKAIVIDVKGAAQARRSATAAKTKDGKAPAKPKWRKLKINDVLEPGVVVRTGRKSQLTLRIGANATMLVERQTRVAIPEIVQKGKVLRTRVSLSFGKADVKVDRIGLENDFEVATPTATLAVRGTAFRIWWDVVNGFRSIGVPGNKIRAIEIRYVDGVKAYMSKADGSSEEYKLPALDAFYATYLEPLQGALSSGEYGTSVSGTDTENDVKKDTGLASSQKTRGTQPRISGEPPDPPPNDPGQPPQQQNKDK